MSELPITDNLDLAFPPSQLAKVLPSTHLVPQDPRDRKKFSIRAMMHRATMIPQIPNGTVTIYATTTTFSMLYPCISKEDNLRDCKRSPNALASGEHGIGTITGTIARPSVARMVIGIIAFGISPRTSDDISPLSLLSLSLLPPHPPSPPTSPPAPGSGFQCLQAKTPCSYYRASLNMRKRGR